MPRRMMLAAKPVRSPITPPPRAIIVEERSGAPSSTVLTTFSTVAKFLLPSPGGNTIVWNASPASRSESSRGAR